MAYVNAVQYSEMTGAGVSVFGLADQWSDFYGAVGSLRLIQSSSRAWMRFAVPARVAYELTGDLSSEPAGRTQLDAFGSELWNLVGRVDVAIRRVAGPDPHVFGFEARVANFDPNCCDVNCGAPACAYYCYTYQCGDPLQASSAPLALASELLPGVYELEVKAETSFDALPSVSFEFGAAPFRIETTMAVTMNFAAPSPAEPCNADLDGDGDVDLIDFARMQTCLNGPA